MTKRFIGKTAMVVGASRGIGLAVARRIAAEGGTVAITARNKDALDEAAGRIADEVGAEVLPIAAHSRRPDERAAAVDEVVTRFGRLDTLVYTTASNISLTTPILDTELDALRKDFDLNVAAALGFVQLACRAAMSRDGGSIVMLSSIAAFGPARLPCYSATKSALQSLTGDLAEQLAPTVRVNAVAPGFVDTAFADSIQRLPKERIDASYPMGHEGGPQEVANAIAFLASEEARWITGSTLVVDGGKLVQSTRHDVAHPDVGTIVH